MIVLEKHDSFFLEYVLYFGGEETMANNSNKKLVPEAMSALDKFKYEVASDDAVKNLFEQYYLKLLHSYFLIIRDLRT